MASPRKLRRLNRRERRVCRRASALVTITQGLLDCLTELHGPLVTAHVIPDGVRVTGQTVLPGGRAPDQPLQVYYTGQLYPWKGVDALVEAMQHLPRAELVIIGGLPPEPDLDRVRALAERLGLSERVLFRGFVPPPQVAEQSAHADLFVIPLLDSTTARHFHFTSQALRGHGFVSAYRGLGPSFASGGSEERGERSSGDTRRSKSVGRRRTKAGG